MSLPVGMHRRAFSYDDALEDLSPMTPPPADMGTNTLWKQPVIRERKYQQLSKDDDGENGVVSSVVIPSSAGNLNKANVVKAKATSVMSSLMTKQTQESIQRFEKQAGLTDAGYQPHKGLIAEEASYHRVGEALQKFKGQSLDAPRDDKQKSLSAQSTPNVTPQPSPIPKRRPLLGQGADFATRSVEGDFTRFEGGAAERCKSFLRSQSHKAAEPGGFTLQSYKGGPKPSPMDIMRTQGIAAKMAENYTNIKPPKMDMPIPEGLNRRPKHTRSVNPRDVNVFAPTGF
ncbi:putative monooxygenase p33MONOX [Callorhinchus milii]|uniref:Putative monooxygenase p33MONOX n=1 Tax=Callorhinchus milii TaxID=7868 RepID=A0A4W3JXP4_CALMI|nr:putative monooxygenase p33MONOX [Callorhinchus milii]|eukprot:gi/632975798/ref/XP_007904429.1/ PREDICTED: putative monooxygenase p33MONOX [Callorhinchus milii]